MALFRGLIVVGIAVAISSPCRVAGQEIAPPEVLAQLGIRSFRHDGNILSLAYSPDGTRLATVGSTLKIWDISTGRLLSEHFGKGQIAHGVAFSPDGKLVAVENWNARSDTSVWVLDLATGDYAPRTVAIESNYGIAFSPDGSLFVRGGVEHGKGLVSLWKVADGAKDESFLKNKGDDIQTIRFAAQASILATQGRNARTFGTPPRVWDMTNSRLIAEFPDDHLIALSPDGKKILTWGYSKPSHIQIRLWDIAAKKILWTRHDRFDISLIYRFLSDSELLEVDYTSAHMICHHLPSAKQTWSIAIPPKLDRYSFRPTLDHAAFLHRDMVIPIRAANPSKVTIKPLAASPRPPDAVVSPDGKTLAVAFGSLVRFFNLETGAETTSDEGHRDRLTSLAFFPDGKRMVSGSRDGSVRLWDLKAKKQIAKIVDGESPTRVALAPDGAWLVVNDAETIHIVDPRTGKTLRHWPAKLDAIVLSPDGKLLAGRKADEKPLFVWNATTGKLAYRFKLPEKDLWTGDSLAFSRDGKLLAVGGHRQILLLDAQIGKVVRRITQFGPEKDFPAPSTFMLPLVQAYPQIRNLAFSPDGLFLYWVNNGGQLHRELLTHPGNRSQRIANRDLAHGAIHFFPSGSTAIFPHHGMLPFVSPVSGKLVHVFYRLNMTVDSPLVLAPHDRRLAFGGSDARIHLLDPWHTARRDVDSLINAKFAWESLAQDGEMFGRMRSLAANPELTLPFLKEKAAPLPRPDPKEVRTWLRDLQSPTFAIREKAMNALPKCEDAILDDLIAVRLETKTLESLRRVDKLLDRCLTDTPQRLRDTRTLDVLEAINTPEAHDVLRIWAAGAPQSRLARQASAALKRLNPATRAGE